MWQVLVSGLVVVFWIVAAVWCISFVVYGPADCLGSEKSRQIIGKHMRSHAHRHPYFRDGIRVWMWLGIYVDLLWAVVAKVFQNGCRYLANAALLLALVCVSLLREIEDGETRDNANKFLDKLLPFIMVLYACHISGVVTRMERKLGDRRDEAQV